MAIRTFLALELDGPIRRAIVAAAESISIGAAKVRWVEEQNLHITLKFLGDVPDGDVMGVCRTVESVAAGLGPIPFEVSHLECIPARGPVKMVWAGVRDESGEIAAAFDELEAALEPLGFDIEPRAFRPHITVGRVRYCPKPAALRSAVEGLGRADFGNQVADEVVVYSSELTRKGPIYGAMSRCSLGQ